ncbi:AMP-binding protein [Kitasatospora sp. NBC_00374]|uniref:AMP-binding protein n=1 Tax=Kitasatospora sp. NBC_00374 TaxID=2975964 RepID=UPI0032464A69
MRSLDPEALAAADRLAEAGYGDRVAIHFEGGLGDTRSLTFAELGDEVSRTAGALRELGVGPGDRVAVYLPVIPEAVVTILACARLGAVPSAVFGLFAGDRAVVPGLRDLDAKVVVTADGSLRPGAPGGPEGMVRHGTPVALKPAVDAALAGSGRVEHVLVVRRTGQQVPWTEGRDLWWHEVVERREAAPEPEPCRPDRRADRDILGLRPGTDVYWCTAEVGWLGGRPHGVFGALAAGVTQVICETSPAPAGRSRFWEIIDWYGVTFLHTDAAAIHALLGRYEELTGRYDLSGLRALCRVTEPNPRQVWVMHRTHDWSGRARAWESCSHPAPARPQPCAAAAAAVAG